eukprot:UN02007
MVSADKGDAALEAYKQSLLGGAVGQDGKAVAKFPNDPRKVIVESVKLVFSPESNAPQAEQILDVTKPGQTVVIKEGSAFSVWVTFYVQHDIALGLKLTNDTSKLGVSVDKETGMLGSYAPKLEPYTIKATEHEAPSGFLARTTYSLTSTLHDDDKVNHCVFSANIKVSKDWE